VRCGIVFTGSNQGISGESEDGILTALEVTNLNLTKNYLTVLSACQTAQGDLLQGEGLYSLKRAFTLGGSHSIIVTLWPIHDLATPKLMSKFYTSLKEGEMRSVALSEAQLEMLNSQKYHSPLYWAAFTLSGDWRRMNFTLQTSLPSQKGE
jgi:CHAT domain-containing protein